MSQPKDRYINPDVGYYGQSAKIGDSCYINTGRVGDMTEFFEHAPATFSLKDHACVCDYFDLNASDHVTDSLYLGSGGSDIGHFDASTKRVDVETTGSDNYINLKYNSLASSNRFAQPTSYLFAGWIKMRSTVGPGHVEVNMFDHRGNDAGQERYGYLVALSSDATNNDGTLSVLIGKGVTGGWNVYSVPGLSTWTIDTKYHVAVLQIGTKLKVYVNGEKMLDVGTSTIVTNGDRNITINSTMIPPVSIERYTYMTTIPDLPETFINQHYNRVVPTPRST